ncbi:unnamed protein product [Rotaria sp. Silwood1]|nr:unnamed protein product [Rotaria sp. Silwood1]
MSWNSTITLNDTSSDFSYILDFVKHQLIVYLSLIFIILGVMGFIGNAFTFFQPSLRFNTCCIYLLCGSFVDVMNLFLNLLNNYLNVTTSYILSLVTVRYLSLSLIDRFACTCSLISSIRHIRRLNMAPWMIVITITISGITALYAPLHYHVVSDLGCVCTNRLFNAILYIIIHCFTTPFVMLVFVLLTYRNVQISCHRAGLKNLANI